MSRPETSPDSVIKTTYTHQSYPSVRYHEDGQQKTVHNEEQDKALGKGWYDKPPKPKPAPAPAPVVGGAISEAALVELANSRIVVNERITVLESRLSELESSINGLVNDLGLGGSKTDKPEKKGK